MKDKYELIPCNHENQYCNGLCIKSKVPDAFKPLVRVKTSYVNARNKYLEKRRVG